MAKGKSSLNLEENIASLLCYVVVWITGILFYFLEKENKTIRFHAMQSILTFLPLTILSTILSWVGFSATITYTNTAFGSIPSGVSQPFLILGYLSWLISVVTFILWLILIIKAYQGEKFKLPVVGDIAEKHA